jgi:hypothetical protein
MLKQALVSALVVLVCVAVAAPNASAGWLHNHVALGLGENPQATFTGTFQFQGLIGKVHCGNMEMKMQMLGGQTDGTVTQFGSQNPAACHASGVIGFSCGTNSIQSVGLQQNATAQITASNTLTVTNVKLLFSFGECAGFLLESDETRDITFSPNNSETISTLQGAGALKTPISGLAFSSSLEVHDPGTYGIKG